MQNRLRDIEGRVGARKGSEQGKGEARTPLTVRSSKAVFDISFYPSISEEFLLKRDSECAV